MVRDREGTSPAESRSVDQLFVDSSRLRSEYARIPRRRLHARARALDQIAATLLQLDLALDSRQMRERA